MSALLLAEFALPALTGAALACSGHRANRAAPFAAIGVAALTVLGAFAAAVTRTSVSAPFVEGIPGGGFGLRVDGLAAVVLPVVTAVAFLVIAYAAAERTVPAARFHGLMLLFLSAVIVTVCATTFPALLAAWEVMGATSYALVGFHWQEPRRVSGGFVAFLTTRTADLGLYLAAGSAVAAGTGWNLAELRLASGPWLHVLAAGVLAAALGKAAQLPFSFWLSRAMEGPSSVSALLHSAAMVAMGGYLLLRLQPLLAAAGWAGPAAAWAGAGTAVVLGVVALAQKDLKQVLAASTASQLGFVVLAAGSGTVLGGAEQLIAHAATKSLLFLVAGVWLTATGTKRLAALHGVARRWPPLGALFTVGALSLAGIPPLSLWFGKDAVLAAALRSSPLLYATGLVGAALAAAYSARVLVLAWRPPGEDAEQRWDAEQRGTRRVDPLTLLPIGVLAAAAALLAIAGLPPLQRALVASTRLPGVAPSGLELAASGGIAVVVVAVILRTGAPHLGLGSDWFRLESLAVTAVAQPTVRLAHLLDRSDRRLSDFVDAVATTTTRTADGARIADDAGLAATVSALGRGVGTLGQAARRPQTGRIHHYYIAASLVTAAAVALLLVVS